jgi:hypothetical protein
MDEGKEGNSRLTALSNAERSSVEPQYYSTYRELQLKISYYSYIKKHRSRWELVRSLLATCSKVLIWEILNCYWTRSTTVSKWFLLFVKAFLAVTPHISIYCHFFVLLSPAILGFSFRILREKALFA